MKIACTDDATAREVLNVLKRYGITRGVHWVGGSPVDEQIRIVVNKPIGSALDAAIRRDIASIAGATMQE